MPELPPGVRHLVETDLGPGALTVLTPGRPRGLVVLGHGAGGQSWSADVLAVHEGAYAVGWASALIDQPWRLAGRRVADRPARLDQAWLSLVRHARALVGIGPLVLGGRSAGARVAARTAHELAADAVLALSFPLHPPGNPAASRAEELLAPLRAQRPVLVIQGARDPFGSPQDVEQAMTAAAPAGHLQVHAVPGSHRLTQPAAVGAVAVAWLDTLGNAEGTAPR